MFKCHVHAIGDEGDEDVRLDTRVGLMKDRTDRKIVFELFERLFDLR